MLLFDGMWDLYHFMLAALPLLIGAIALWRERSPIK
jgi:hypothetical protein